MGVAASVVAGAGAFLLGKQTRKGVESAGHHGAVALRSSGGEVANGIRDGSHTVGASIERSACQASGVLGSSVYQGSTVLGSSIQRGSSAMALSVERGSATMARSVEQSSARLADAALRSGDLMGKHIALGLLQAVDKMQLEVSNESEQWRVKFDELVNRILDDHRDNWDRALAQLSQDGYKLASGVRSEIDSNVHKFWIGACISFFVLSLVPPMFYSELTSNTTMFVRLVEYLRAYTVMLAYVRVYHLVALVPVVAVVYALVLAMDLVYSLRLMEKVVIGLHQRSQITHDNADGTDIPAPDSNVKDIQSTGLSDDEPADAKQDAPASSGDEADTSTSGDEAIVRRAVEVLSRTRESDAKMCESNVSQITKSLKESQDALTSRFLAQKDLMTLLGIDDSASFEHSMQAIRRAEATARVNAASSAAKLSYELKMSSKYSSSLPNSYASLVDGRVGYPGVATRSEHGAYIQASFRYPVRVKRICFSNPFYGAFETGGWRGYSIHGCTILVSDDENTWRELLTISNFPLNFTEAHCLYVDIPNIVAQHWRVQRKSGYVVTGCFKFE